jgi:hypothetical protein
LATNVNKKKSIAVIKSTQMHLKNDFCHSQLWNPCLHHSYVMIEVSATLSKCEVACSHCLQPSRQTRWILEGQMRTKAHQYHRRENHNGNPPYSAKIFRRFGHNLAELFLR